MLKIYEYKNCTTCKQALKFLDAKQIPYRAIPIVEQPPTLVELKAMLAYIKADGLTLKNLFNTSGVQYRELKIADRLKGGLSESEALKLLADNGKLIKRPFVLSEKTGRVGFKPEQWKDLK
jgi:arsenate reductase